MNNNSIDINLIKTQSPYTRFVSTVVILFCLYKIWGVCAYLLLEYLSVIFNFLELDFLVINSYLLYIYEDEKWVVDAIIFVPIYFLFKFCNNSLNKSLNGVVLFFSSIPFVILLVIYSSDELTGIAKYFLIFGFEGFVYQDVAKFVVISGETISGEGYYRLRILFGIFIWLFIVPLVFVFTPVMLNSINIISNKVYPYDVGVGKIINKLKKIQVGRNNWLVYKSPRNKAKSFFYMVIWLFSYLSNIFLIYIFIPFLFIYEYAMYKFKVNLVKSLSQLSNSMSNSFFETLGSIFSNDTDKVLALSSIGSDIISDKKIKDFTDSIANESIYTALNESGLLVPVLIIISFFSIWLLRMARRHAAPNAQEMLTSDRRAPVLYLRSFNDDGLSLHSHFSIQYLFSKNKSIEEIISSQSIGFGPFVAIGAPGEKLPLLGASRDYVDDRDWKAVISNWVVKSRFIVMVCGRTESVQWEIQNIIEQKYVYKLIIVMPPIDEGYLLECWGNLASCFVNTPWYESIKNIEVTGVIMLTFRPSGGVNVLRSSRYNEKTLCFSFYLGLYDIFFHSFKINNGRITAG